MYILYIYENLCVFLLLRLNVEEGNVKVFPTIRCNISAGWKACLHTRFSRGQHIYPTCICIRVYCKISHAASQGSTSVHVTIDTIRLRDIFFIGSKLDWSLGKSTHHDIDNKMNYILGALISSWLLILQSKFVDAKTRKQR